MSAHRHTIHDHQGHFGWNNANPPVATVAPGDSVEFHQMDASGGRLTSYFPRVVFE